MSLPGGLGSDSHPFWTSLLTALHNYLAANSTLIDHSRNLLREYEGSFRQEYNRRVEVVARLPEAAFLKRLRNYFLHAAVPPVAFVTQVIREPPTETRFVAIDRDPLLRTRGDWSQLARSYVESQPAQIPLRKAIDAYSAAIEELYRWAYSQFTVLHGDEIQGVNTLINRQRGGR